MNIPLSLYIHFPWCVKKCPYCDFNSHEAQGEVPQAAYINALIKDLRAELPQYDGREIQSIFMGGGTPSLFDPESITNLLRMLKTELTFSPNIEITLEANPGTTDYEKFEGYFAAGINRLSMGVQSFSDQHLSQLGRIHSSHDVFNAYRAATLAGFTNINIDLMHGLNRQTLDGAMHDLNEAISLKPKHISWYQLTIEPNTQFYKNPPLLPQDELLWDIYESGLEKLSVNGFARYEISAFSQANHQSRHNLNYWLFGDYIGIGAGAHGKLTTENSIRRSAKTRIPKDYLSHQRSKITEVQEAEIPLEFLMNALRLSNGFALGLFTERTGLETKILDSFTKKGEEAGLIHYREHSTEPYLRPTPRGLQFLNELLMMI